MAVTAPLVPAVTMAAASAAAATAGDPLVVVVVTVVGAAAAFQLAATFIRRIRPAVAVAPVVERDGS